MHHRFSSIASYAEIPEHVLLGTLRALPRSLANAVDARKALPRSVAAAGAVHELEHTQSAPFAQHWDSKETYLGSAVQDLTPGSNTLEPANHAAAKLLDDGSELGQNTKPGQTALLDDVVAGGKDAIEVNFGAVALEAVDCYEKEDQPLNHPTNPVWTKNQATTPSPVESLTIPISINNQIPIRDPIDHNLNLVAAVRQVLSDNVHALVAPSKGVIGWVGGQGGSGLPLGHGVDVVGRIVVDGGRRSQSGHGQDEGGEDLHFDELVVDLEVLAWNGVWLERVIGGLGVMLKGLLGGEMEREREGR
jgi:hypothetical protein